MPALQYSLAVERMVPTKPSRSLEHITLVNLDAAKSLLISDEFAASRTSSPLQLVEKTNIPIAETIRPGFLTNL